MSDVKPFDKLSDRQKRILVYIFEYVQSNGFPPTIREIGNNTDINSTSVVNYNLNKLVDAGYLDRTDKKSRGLRLIAHVPGTTPRQVRHTSKVAKIGLYGHIAAGQPIEVPEDLSADDDDAIELPRSMLGNIDPLEVFALRVRGDSMIDAMITEDDLVILRKQTYANNGDMVAVWLPEQGETTLKYFYNEGERIRLQPAHPTMDAIYVDARNCEVRGKVLTVIRQIH